MFSFGFARILYGVCPPDGAVVYMFKACKKSQYILPFYGTDSVTDLGQLGVVLNYLYAKYFMVNISAADNFFLFMF